MNRIAEVFGSRRVLLPVVHPETRTTALESIRVCHSAGVQGIWLIDQGMSCDEVVAFVGEVRALYPKLWIGVNLLARGPVQALADLLGVHGWCDGIWSDNAGVDERQAEQPRPAEFVRARGAWRGLYFGGVAFKYQREVPRAELGKAAALATHYLDVICSSGPGTGYAADVEKVAALRAGAGDHAIALASGVTPENVHEYIPYVDAYLVGTGIEARFGVIDPAKLEALQAAMQRA